MDDPIRVVVAVSGGGRSLDHLIDLQSTYSTYQIVAVISSNPLCQAQAKAKNLYDLPIYEFTAKDCHEHASLSLQAFLSKSRCDLIVLAGFLKKFPTIFDQEQHLSRRIINIHPALLPKYGGKGMYGMRVHRKVFMDCEKVSGATVHWVNHSYDEGQIISQKTVDISALHSPEAIAKAVFEAECQLLPKVVHELAAEI